MKETNMQELQQKLVKTLLKAGVTDNCDIVTVLRPLCNHDKLRGVKRSITVSSKGYKLPCKKKPATASCGKKCKAKNHKKKGH